MTVKELIAKLCEVSSLNRKAITYIYAPVEGYEDTYVRLDILSYDYENEEVLGYNVTQYLAYNDIQIVINKPVIDTTIHITVNYADGTKGNVRFNDRLSLKYERLYDFWSPNNNYKTGEAWQDPIESADEQ